MKTTARLDNAVLDKYPNLTRSLIQKLIKGGYVRLNGKPVSKAGTSIKNGDSIELVTDILSQEIEDVELPVLYEDENCVVVNKPAGMLTHSKGAFNPEPTVASWLKGRPHFSFAQDEDRAGVVHRLDRATSGVIICAKNKQTLGYLQKQFQQRTVKKIYSALVSGRITPNHAILDLPIERNPKKPQTFRVGINGKEARTEYRVVEEYGRSSLLDLMPLTGRTHQLRVHLLYLHHPIIGDILYGGKSADRLYLHAKSLEITLPGGIRKTFEVAPPAEFLEQK